MKRHASSPSVAGVRKEKPAIARNEPLTAAPLNNLHKTGAGLSAHLNLANARRPGREVQRVNVDFPVDLLKAIDQEARRIGVARQAFIKLRLADSLGRH